jgi:hypothetical protein
MPAFTFEKISPPVRRGAGPVAAKKQRGVIVRIIGRFVGVRGKRTPLPDNRVIVRRAPK